jgi:hypothetical protein
MISVIVPLVLAPRSGQEPYNTWPPIIVVGKFFQAT